MKFLEKYLHWKDIFLIQYRSGRGCNKRGKINWFYSVFITFTVFFLLQFDFKECAILSPLSGPQPWKRFFFFEHLIRPHLSRPKTSIQQSIPSPAEGLRSGFWKRQSHRMAPGTGPGTSSDTHISYYAVRAFLFSTHYLVNVDTAGVYQKMPLLYVES